MLPAGGFVSPLPIGPVSVPAPEPLVLSEAVMLVSPVSAMSYVSCCCVNDEMGLVAGILRQHGVPRQVPKIRRDNDPADPDPGDGVSPVDLTRSGVAFEVRAVRTGGGDQP